MDPNPSNEIGDAARHLLLDETTISSSPHISGMPKGIPSGLRPHGEAVRLVADRNFPHLSGRCVDCVHDVVVPAGKPEHSPIGADVPQATRGAVRAMSFVGKSIPPRSSQPKHL